MFVYLHLFRSVCLTQCKSDDKARMGREGGDVGGERERRRLLEGQEVLTEQYSAFTRLLPYAAHVLALRQTSGHVVLHISLNPLNITLTTHTRILGWLGRAHLRAPYEDTYGASCATAP